LPTVKNVYKKCLKRGLKIDKSFRPFAKQNKQLSQYTNVFVSNNSIDYSEIKKDCLTSDTELSQTL